MNWLSCEEPKNSFSAATTERDVDDRLRRDRVRVLGGEALADHSLHPVEADAEGLLDQLADRAQAAVAEVLVLVEPLGDRLARHETASAMILDRLPPSSGPSYTPDSGMPSSRSSATKLDQLDDVARVSVQVSSASSRCRRLFSL